MMVIMRALSRLVGSECLMTEASITCLGIYVPASGKFLVQISVTS